ncbi:hypothetical protein E2C01_089897 [Portunus trituberculatus]|uniref:Uncharacterized protein n=1 Tax=Portunus trituberculatus TaxID=210409 RepID=A0A5B7JKI1_PORTR|nr:hypothetical protein [Portunus trituberculatus]
MRHTIRHTFTNEFRRHHHLSLYKSKKTRLIKRPFLHITDKTSATFNSYTHTKHVQSNPSNSNSNPDHPVKSKLSPSRLFYLNLPQPTLVQYPFPQSCPSPALPILVESKPAPPSPAQPCPALP